MRLLSNRPFPTNWQALKACRTSYSQFGEDLLARQLVGWDRRDGFYVDVGCYHPIRYSNTYLFYQRGWRGICIDANPAMSTAWKRYRPRDVFVNAAVSAQDVSMNYYMDPVEPYKNFLSEDAGLPVPSGGSLTRIPSESLSSLLTKNSAAPITAIDLMTVDCEGFDLQVLQTHDFELVRPKVLIVEDFDLSSDSAIQQFCISKGYVLRAYCMKSRIFVCEP
jgi:FkbM family methyltransferase